MREIGFGYVMIIAFIRGLVVPTVFGSAPHPEFASLIPSLQIIAGRDATLKCVIRNLGDFKVAWVYVEKQALLSLGNHVFTRDERISVSTPNSSIWYLHLKNVMPSDSGYYTCQINTQPMMSQVGHLDVVVPPEFVNNMTNRNITIAENSNLTLSCKATGNPEPVITWKREDGQPFVINGTLERQYYGDELSLVGVTKLHMGAYICLASNSIPPSISRRIYIEVTFAPLIWIQNQLIGAHENTDITIECHTQAHPPSHNEWLREEDSLLPRNERYKTFISTNSYKVHMKLTIKQLKPEDYGTYKCVAKNSIMETKSSITLYKLKATVKPQIIYSEFRPTRTTIKTTEMVTTDQPVVTAEVERRDHSYYSGSQQKYGDGRKSPSPKNSGTKHCNIPWAFVVILRILISCYMR